MASFQYSPAAAGYLDTLLDFSTWVRTSVTSTAVVWQAGDFRMVLSGTGLSAGNPPTGTITGMTLYQTDVSSGVAVERPLIVSTAPLALSFKGLLDAIAMPPDGNDSPLVYLFSGNDVLSGSTGADELAGFAGSDSITGGAGSDYLIGDFGYEDAALPAPGNDTLVGGDGNDTLQGNGGADTLDGGNGNDSLEGETGADNMLGGGGNDTMEGGDGNDNLNGGTGNDSMTGGKGNDSYFVDAAGDFTREASSGGGIDTVTSIITWTLATEIDNLVLSGTTAINGTGNAMANTITGNTGNNSLSGVAGNDSLSGGSGNDSLLGGDGNDTLSGGNGDDVLNGGTGNDSMTGGAGNDSFFVDAAGDKTVEATSGGGIDTVTSTLTWTLATEIDNLLLSGTTAINGTGNAMANTITGNTGNNSLSGVAGNDSLSGGSGSDSLLGGDGNDTLNGGAGNDSLTGGNGNDSYFVDATGDKTTEATSGGGIDTVTATLNWTLASEIDKLVLSGTTAINGTGNALANTMTGNSGNNSLNGSGGNDTLTGGAGNDVLTGGSNNDQFVLNSLTGSDTFSDFVSGTDRMIISQAGVSVGDGNTTISGGVLKTGPGGFANSAELVVISGNISGAITTASAAAKIGSATSAYAVGQDVLFAVDNGSSSAIYLFTAADASAAVSSAELTLLATLTATPQLALADFLFA